MCAIRGECMYAEPSIWSQGRHARHVFQAAAAEPIVKIGRIATKIGQIRSGVEFSL